MVRCSIYAYLFPFFLSPFGDEPRQGEARRKRLSHGRGFGDANSNQTSENDKDCEFNDLTLGSIWKFHHIKQIGDRKSTRLNSSHQIISYAVFCLKKKT